MGGFVVKVVSGGKEIDRVHHPFRAAGSAPAVVFCRRWLVSMSKGVSTRTGMSHRPCCGLIIAGSRAGHTGSQ